MAFDPSMINPENECIEDEYNIDFTDMSGPKLEYHFIERDFNYVIEHDFDEQDLED